MTSGVALVVRRTIAADARRVFEAWTTPEYLRAWWGPRPVRCAEADVDLRVGGHYRIVNAMPNGGRIVIEGEFTLVDRYTKLIYTWKLSPGTGATELVTVKFEARGEGTEVIVVHEQIATPSERDSHENGWVGCFDELERFVVG